MADGGHRRHVSNYLLDKSLQLRYIVFVTMVSAALYGALGYLLWQQEGSATQSVIRTLETSGFGADLEAEIIGELGQRDTSRVFVLVGAGAATVLLLSVFLLVMTHKVAGPLHKVSRYFDEMAHGKLSEVYPLRKGDQLTGFYDKFKDMHDTVRARHRREMDAVREFLERCPLGDVAASGELARALDEARAHLARRDEQLA